MSGAIWQSGRHVIKITMRREIKDFIRLELRNYDNTKQEWEDIHTSIVDASPYMDGQPRGSDVSNPTESKAIRLITNKRLEQLERTMKAVERIVTNLPSSKLKLVQLKYWTEPQLLTDIGIAQKLNCSRSTFYEWDNMILTALAREMGFID
jgi:RinA family phage transcriptional activator